MTQERTFSPDEVHTALCIHELALIAYEESDKRWNTGQGIDALRHSVTNDIAPKVQQAWESVRPEYDEPFDFEFLPNVLATVGDLTNATLEQYIDAAKLELARATSETSQLFASKKGLGQ